MPKVMPEYKEEVKKKIVRAALEIGEEKGLSNIRMEDVAGKIGISRATLYLYFSNRDELIAEGNRAFCDDISRRMAETFEGEDYRDVLIALFDDFLFRADGYGTNTVVEMFAEAVKDERMRDVIGCSYFDMKHLISVFITEQKKNGRVPEGVDPDLAGGILQSVALGMKLGAVVGLERDKAKKIWVSAVEKILFS